MVHISVLYYVLLHMNIKIYYGNISCKCELDLKKLKSFHVQRIHLTPRLFVCLYVHCVFRVL